MSTLLRAVLRGLKRLRNAFLVLLAAFVIFVEEWLWFHLAALMARIGRLPVLRWIEARVAALPPYAAMTVFLFPALVLLPFKFAALWLIATGRALTGVILIIAAKGLSTALVARIFMLVRPQLLTLGWFARLHDWYLGFRDRVMARLHGLAAWRLARRVIARWKAAWRGWRAARGGHGWGAARKIARRRG